GNTDGPADISWNSGFNGDDGAPAEVIALRKRQAKNLLCVLLLANGTPMLRAGDEFLQTQNGNNNPYNQDNATTWLDWNRLESHADVFRFTRLMIAFRKAHPSLCRSRFWREDVRWYGVGPAVDLSDDSRSLAFCLSGASQGDDDLYVMANAYGAALEFTIQPGAAGSDRAQAAGGVRNLGAPGLVIEGRIHRGAHPRHHPGHLSLSPGARDRQQVIAQATTRLATRRAHSPRSVGSSRSRNQSP